MSKDNNKNIVLILMGGIIIILVFFVVLFATNTIEFKNSNMGEEQKSDNNDSNYSEEVERLSNWVFNYINSLSVYCGDNMKWNNEDDFIPHPNASYMHLYDVSQDFKSISELNSYIKNYISDEMVDLYSRDGYSYDIYKEQDGKLYCLNSNKDNGVFFDEEKTSYKIIETSENEINVVGNVAYYEKGNLYPTYDVTQIKINKEGNKWIISSYANIYTGMVNVGLIEYYLNDVIINNKLNSDHKIVIIYGNETYSSSDEIKNVANIIEGIYTSSNGEKWIQPHLEYDQNGYVTKIIF